MEGPPPFLPNTPRPSHPGAVGGRGGGERRDPSREHGLVFIEVSRAPLRCLPRISSEIVWVENFFVSGVALLPPYPSHPSGGMGTGRGGGTRAQKGALRLGRP